MKFARIPKFAFFSVFGSKITLSLIIYVFFLSFDMFYNLFQTGIETNK